MRRSFKLRMAALSVFTSGLILAAFASLFLSVIRRTGLERIDRELQVLGDAQVRGPKPHRHWEHFDESLASIYGETRRSEFLVRVTGRDHRSLYVSPHWPAAIPAAALGIPETPGPSLDPDFLRPPFDAQFRGDPPPPPPLHPTPPRWQTIPENGRTWRFVLMGNEQVTLAVGMNLADFHRELQRYRRIFGIAVPVALILLAAGGWLLAGQAIRPVTALTQVAARITARGLDQRVRTEDADREFQALVDVINGMLDRLEKSFRQATRFSADAAHELKTPLTILQGQLQQAVRQAPADSAEQRRYAELIEEVQRLKVIVRKLLLLAQADAGEMRLNPERLCLSAEVGDLLDDARQMAGGLQVTGSVEPDVFVLGDPDLLRQALQNLVSNAIKYNRDGGTVELRLRRDGSDAVFGISNTIGPETRIAPEMLFERFYRGDKARSREVEGAGLGLSLAREIARAHGGDLKLEALRADAVAFALRIPAAG